MNSYEGSLKLYTPKPIRLAPKSAPYGKSRSLTDTAPYKITRLPSRIEDWNVERLVGTEVSDDRLAAMAEIESELLKRTASFPLMGTAASREGFSSCRSCTDFLGLERPDNPMAHTFDTENSQS